MAVNGSNTVQFSATLNEEVSKGIDKIRQSIGNFSNKVKNVTDQANRNFNQSLSKVSEWAKSNEQAFRDMRNQGAVALALIAGGAVKARNEANALTESTNAVSVVFQDAADIITEFGKTSATSVGLARSEFQQMATETGSLLKNAGIPMDEVAEKTLELTNRAADLASVFDKDVSLAMSAINQALRGETEAIRKFSADVTDATLEQYALANGLNANVTKMTQQEKVLLRLQVMMSQTNQVANDFQNTIGSNANQNRILTAETKNAAAALGESLMPIFQDINKLLLPIIQNTGDFVEENKSMTRIVIGSAAGVSGLAVVLGTLGLVLPKIVIGIKAVGTALTVMGGPIGFVVLAVSGLFAAWKTNFLGIQEIAEQFLSDAKRVFGQIGSDVKRVRQAVKEGTDFIKSILFGLANSALMRGQNMIESLVQGIRSGIDAVGDAVEAVAGKIKAFLGFSSPTEEGPGSTSDQWMPNLVKMLATGMIAGIPTVASASGQLAGTIESGVVNVIESSVRSELEGKYQETEDIINKFGSKTGETYIQMRDDFTDRSDGLLGTMEQLNSEFDQKTSDIISRAKDLAFQFNELKKTFSMDTNDENRSLAEEIVNQRDKIVSIEQQIADKRGEIQDGVSGDRLARLNRELVDLQDQLSREKRAYSDASQYRISLSNEIAEVERRNRLTGFERYLEDRQSRQNKRVQEFNEKKDLMQQEAIELVKQQKAIIEVRKTANNIINGIIKSSSETFMSSVQDQASITQNATQRMMQYYQGVTNKINQMAEAARRASSFGPGFSFAGGIQRFSNGGIVQGAPSKSDTVPAMLTPGELVLNAAQQSNLARRINNNNSVSVVISGNAFYGSDPEFVNNIGEKIIEKLKTNLSVPRY